MSSQFGCVAGALRVGGPSYHAGDYVWLLGRVHQGSASVCAQPHLVGVRLRHATACSSRTLSLAEISAVLSVPSTSLSVSSSLATQFGRMSHIRLRHVRRVQVPSGLQSDVHAAEAHLQQLWLRRLDELRVRTPANYELPSLVLPHSDQHEIRDSGAGA